MSAIRGGMVLLLLACITPARASADWLLTPFAGLKFAGDTTFVADLEHGAQQTKLTFGGSLALLGSGIPGLEVDFGYSPRFFERVNSSGGLVARSSVTTLMGNVIIAVPRRFTRESLRPYVIGGLGLMHAGIEDIAHIFELQSNLLGLSVGAGAFGPLTERTSLRFDLRYLSNLTKDDRPSIGIGATRLSFWRATAGVTLRVP